MWLVTSIFCCWKDTFWTLSQLSHHFLLNKKVEMGENGSVSGQSKALGKTVHFSVAHLGMDLTSLLRLEDVNVPRHGLGQRAMPKWTTATSNFHLQSSWNLQMRPLVVHVSWWKSAGFVAVQISLSCGHASRIFERSNISMDWFKGKFTGNHRFSH